MKNRTLLRTGIAGTIITALCCLTPVLVVLLGIAGLSTVTGYLDFVLFPVLVFFLGLTVHALRRKRCLDQFNQQGDGS